MTTDGNISTLSCLTDTFFSCDIPLSPCLSHSQSIIGCNWMTMYAHMLQINEPNVRNGDAVECFHSRNWLDSALFFSFLCVCFVATKNDSLLKTVFIVQFAKSVPRYITAMAVTFLPLDVVCQVYAMINRESEDQCISVSFAV